MDNSENANNHDGEGEMEVLEEEHIESEPQPASGEEPADDTKPDNDDQAELKDEDMQVEKLEDEGDEEVDGEAKNDEDEDEDTKDIKKEPKADGEKQGKTRRRDGEPADLEICRVCQSKDSLSDIFEFDDSIRICDMIIKLCPAVRITERDHLPHKICKGCVEKVKIAHEFKTTCENTDKELRKTLKRSYNKSRRTTDFVIVNCPMSDEEDNDDEEQQDDDEYKVSQSEVESEPVTSDDSFEPATKKLKKTPKRRGRKPKSESSGPTPGSGKRRRGRQPGYSPVAAAATTPVRRGPGRPPGRGPGRPPKSASKSPGLANVVYIEAPDASSDSDSDDDKPIRGRKSNKSHDCTKCDESFRTGVELKEHLVTHKGDLFPCTKCDKSFKSKVYLSNHLERHDQDDKRREEKIKAKELKKQAQRQKEIQKRRDHDDRSKRPKDSGSAEKKRKPEPSPANSGRDLFKCVAPLTSTYWSDSFSD